MNTNTEGTQTMNQYKETVNKKRTGKKTSLKKAREAVNNIHVLFSTVDNEDYGGLLGDLMAEVLDYFMPSIKSKAKTDPTAWAYQAVSTDMTKREYLTYGYSDEGNVICTDGKRMHIAKGVAPEGSEGKYLLGTGQWIKLNLNYPTYKHVMPHKDELIKTTILKSIVEGMNEEATITLEFDNGKSSKYNLKFYKELMAQGCTDLWIFKHHLNDTHLLVIDTPDKYGILMPLFD